MTPLLDIEEEAGRERRQGGDVLSFPIPVLRSGRLEAWILRYERLPDPSAPTTIYPPNRLIVFDADTGALVESRDIRAAEVGLDWPDDRPLEHFPVPRGDVDTWLAQRQELRELGEFVWPAFAAGERNLGSDSLRAVARYTELWERTEPDALWPYMRHVGAPFWAWVVEIGAVAAAPK